MDNTLASCALLSVLALLVFRANVTLGIECECALNLLQSEARDNFGNTTAALALGQSVSDKSLWLRTIEERFGKRYVNATATAAKLWPGCDANGSCTIRRDENDASWKAMKSLQFQHWESVVDMPGPQGIDSFVPTCALSHVRLFHVRRPEGTYIEPVTVLLRGCGIRPNIPIFDWLREGGDRGHTCRNANGLYGHKGYCTLRELPQLQSTSSIPHYRSTPMPSAGTEVHREPASPPGILDDRLRIETPHFAGYSGACLTPGMTFDVRPPFDRHTLHDCLGGCAKAENCSFVIFKASCNNIRECRGVCYAFPMACSFTYWRENSPSFVAVTYVKKNEKAQGGKVESSRFWRNKPVHEAEGRQDSLAKQQSNASIKFRGFVGNESATVGNPELLMGEITAEEPAGPKDKRDAVGRGNKGASFDGLFRASIAGEPDSNDRQLNDVAVPDHGKTN